MKNFVKFLLSDNAARPLHWTLDQGALGQLPEKGVALALAPHPSDAERAAIFLKRLHDRGWDVHNAICSKGVAGVLDRYTKPFNTFGELEDLKAEIRRQEAIKSACEFGVDKESVHFLYDDFEELGRDDSEQDVAAVSNILDEIGPDIVTLPSGNDANRTHKGVYAAFRAAAAGAKKKPLVAFYHEDPKTLSFDPELYVWFGRAESLFKGKLLIAHDSQQQRRIERSGEGLDDLILRTNFDRARRYKATADDAPDLPFAEAFEIETFA